MGLSQHPINIGWLAWISIIPLLFVYAYINTYKAFFIISYIWGLCYYLTVIFWLAFNIGTTPFFGFVSMFLAVLYCSINSTIIGLILCFIKKHKQNKWYWALPSIWVCVEYIRNMDILSGGPWTAIANTQTDFLILAQNVEITGIYGISFWIILAICSSNLFVALDNNGIKKLIDHKIDE